MDETKKKMDAMDLMVRPGRDRGTPLVLSGEWISHGAREGKEPEVMVELLLKTVIGITREQATRIVEGRAELVGDSQSGLFLRRRTVGQANSKRR